MFDYAIAGINSSINATTAQQLAATSSSTTAIILIIIVIILSRRMYQGIKGQKFSMQRLLMLPLIYIALTFLFLFEFPVTYLDVVITIFAVGAGVLSGLRFGRSVTFFEKDGVTHYKRSPLIMSIWIISYIARFGLEFLAPQVTAISFIVEVLLGFSSGLLLGETIHIRSKYKEHKAKNAKT